MQCALNAAAAGQSKPTLAPCFSLSLARGDVPDFSLVCGLVSDGDAHLKDLPEHLAWLRSMSHAQLHETIVRQRIEQHQRTLHLRRDNDKSASSYSIHATSSEHHKQQDGLSCLAHLSLHLPAA